ncbi:MAG: hypothetical protein COT18_11975, partial [Elusimicrobia bacterium CG08_land_8_20_14_0_20_59_10]
KYYLYLRAGNAAGQELLYYPPAASTHAFVYDVTAPTVTAGGWVAGLSTDSVNPTYANEVTYASGTVADNVSDALDKRQVYLRVYDVDADKYLNPNTAARFDYSNAATAWALYDTVGDAWSYDLSASQFTTGNKYRLEIYGEDKAGNKHTENCPWTTESGPGDCQTGSSNMPKYARYFIYNKLKPVVTIDWPVLVPPNYIGSTLDSSSGTASGFGVNLVQYALKYNKSDPTQHWRHYTSSGAWVYYSGNLWNTAYNPAGDWSVWVASNVAWVDGEAYLLTVRAWDSAGNVSNEQEISFTYDVSAPTSTVVYPVSGTEYTVQVLSVSGTAQDRVSTGTPAGLDQTFHAGIQRESDSYWWDGSTWTALRDDPSTLISQGTGVKDWSLTLPGDFYDLLTVSRDTFTVYSWGVDLVNVPDPSYANVESSLTPKCVFYFRSDAPAAYVKWPPAASVQNDVSSVTLNISAVGAGVSQVWAVFIDTGGYYWTGSSWSLTGGYDPATDSEVWLSTDSAVAGPDMVFTPPRSESDMAVTFDGATDIAAPAWADGREYKVFVRANNSAGQLVDTYASPGTYKFVYDISRPTMTPAAALTALSDAEGSPTWVTNMNSVSGLMDDNYAGSLNPLYAYLRVFSIDQGKYLNPSTLAFDVADGADAWKAVSMPEPEYSRAWAWDISGAAWLGGNTYKLEMYGRDMAGNSDGNDGVGAHPPPKYTKYFRLDNVLPASAVAYPQNGGIYGQDSLLQLKGNASDSGSGVTAVEYRLEYPAMASKWKYYVTSGAWLTAQEFPIWNVAETTTTPSFSTWVSSNINWVDGIEYTFISRVRDLAGNYGAAYSTMTFTYDASKPTTTVTVPIDGAVYSGQLATLSGTAKDMPDRATAAGLQWLYLGVQRLSDGGWWTGLEWAGENARDDAPQSPPTYADPSWEAQSMSGFWDGIPSAETFYVYAWSTDK